MNETQSTYVERIRTGQLCFVQACNDLADLDPVAYTNPGFREMLFAIDGMNRFHSAAWQSVFVRGLVEHSDWIDGGRLVPRAYSEVADNQIRHGYGEYGVNLILDLYEEVTRKPVNATSFTRRTIREYFNGVQPLEERTLFLVKRFFSLQQPLKEEDIRLLFHIREETKGLRNAPEFDHYFSKMLCDWLVDGGQGEQVKRERLALWYLGCADEITEAESRLIRKLKDNGISLPPELLQHIDLSRDQLMGIG